MADFSGYLAIDEAYDGAFCILSVVDNRRYRRLAFRVLDHKPKHADVRLFLAEFKAHLDQRGLKVLGITTDGSSLYPRILKELWPGVPHQRCRFHVLMEITKAVLRALATLRKELAAQAPKLPRGRPRKADAAKVRQAKRIKERVAELFAHRHLFVRRHLSAAQKRVLKRLVRGQPHLRVLRSIMDEVYRLFDRRCRMRTALRRLAKLRRRVRRFAGLRRTLGTLFSPTLEKALLFLDDKLLGSTSNAAERANRRFRKAQKSIYKVRTKPHLEERLALDLYRDLWAAKRGHTLNTLHRARAHSYTRHRPRSDPDSDHCCCLSVPRGAGSWGFHPFVRGETMAMFVELVGTRTGNADKGPVYVNPDNVVWVRKENEGLCRVMCIDGNPLYIEGSVTDTLDKLRRLEPV